MAKSFDQIVREGNATFTRCCTLRWAKGGKVRMQRRKRVAKRDRMRFSELNPTGVPKPSIGRDGQPTTEPTEYLRSLLDELATMAPEDIR